ncbi:MAG: hypothetical protein R6W90_10635 [Ignavibacteriaceae bacterium]
MKIKKSGIIIFSLSILLLAGCREEVISPDNPAYNINEPVKESVRNSYTFSINAANLFLNHIDFPNLTTNKTRAAFTITDYNSGYIDVTILSNGRIIYQGQFETNLNNEIKDLSGLFPTRINIKCENFTGKVKIQLSGI